MVTLSTVIDSSAAELADSMLVDRPDGLTVPVNDAHQVESDPCSSIDERRNAHGAAYRSFDPTYRASPHALRPVAFDETDAEISICSMAGWQHGPYTVKMGPSEARFLCIPTLTVSVNEL